MTVFCRLLAASCLVLSLCAPAAVASGSTARPASREFKPLRRRRRAVDKPHGAPTPLSVALEKANRLWGELPCGGRYRVELTTLPPEVRGHASWLEPAGSTGPYTTPNVTWTDCVIQLPAAAWTREGVESEWPDACTVVLHEWGHLTGHPHSNEPGEPPEPPGMTPEQLQVMQAAPPVDLPRCGWEP